MPTISTNLCHHHRIPGNSHPHKSKHLEGHIQPNTHKCGLFADNLLLFITSPVTSLPVVCKFLDEFSKVSGLQVNFAKFQAPNVSLQPSLVAQLKDSFKFEWSESTILYLGINLTPKFEQLYSANYPLTYQKLETDLKTWAQHELSWLGKINAIKMTLLPRLLYLFCSLPILIKKDPLSLLQSKIVRFV